MEWIIGIIVSAITFFAGWRVGFNTGQDKGFMEGLMVNRWRPNSERHS